MVIKNMAKWSATCAYAERIPGARFKSIANAGHYPHLEQTKACADQVLAFARG